MEIIKSIIFGIIEGITEWLPISSTGHLILLNEFLKLDVSKYFYSMFEVVIQLGAIMAVIILFWKKIFPFYKKNNQIKISKDIMSLWGKIIVACIPAAIIGILFDDWLDEHLYNGVVVSIALIVYGIIFIIIESKNIGSRDVDDLSKITYKQALGIGGFQLLSLIPGTSRSGSTIIGGLILGLERSVAAEFTFFLAIPVMFGASLLKIVKFGFGFTTSEIIVLLVGMFTAFIVLIAFSLLFSEISEFNSSTSISSSLFFLLFFLLSSLLLLLGQH